MKFLKFSITLLIGFLVVAGVGFGRYLASYAHTTTRCVHESVRQAVPVEFELQRARDMIKRVVPKLRANIRAIACEEVEVDRLQAEVVGAQTDVQNRRQLVTELQSRFEVQQTPDAKHDNDLSRQQLAEQLASQFEQYKRSKSILTHKQSLLKTRRKSLQAAQLLLARTRSQKAELEQQIEELIAHNRLLKTQAATSRFCADNSQLDRVEALMTDLTTRLETARRMLDHEMAFPADEIPVHLDDRSDEGLLAASPR